MRTSAFILALLSFLGTARSDTIAEWSHGYWTIYAWAEGGVFDHCGIDSYSDDGSSLGLSVYVEGLYLGMCHPRHWNLPRNQSLGSVIIRIDTRYVRAVTMVSGIDGYCINGNLGWDGDFLRSFALGNVLSLQFPNGTTENWSLRGTLRTTELLSACLDTYGNYSTNPFRY